MLKLDELAITATITNIFVSLQTLPGLAQSLKARSNPLNIDWDPAPSPKDGPPLSAGASRDKASLPAQIGGIIGSYVFVVAVVCIALIIIGRRLRFTAQRSRRALDVEMVEPVLDTNAFYPTPTSPGGGFSGPRNFSWPSPDKTDRNPYIFPSFNSAQPIPGGDPFVDNQVMEADREMMQRDLEDIYAHVMKHEEAKAAGIKLKDNPQPNRIMTQFPPPSTEIKEPVKVPEPAPQRQTLFPPKSKKKPGAIDIEKSVSEKSHSRTSSIISALRSPRRKGLRGMQISSPIPTPLSAAFPANVSDEEPLSPRYYAPPPPPPVPTSTTTFPHQRQGSNDPSPISPTRSIASALNPINRTHKYNTSATSSVHSHEPQSANSQTPLNPQANMRSAQPPKEFPMNYTATNPSRALPFRAFDPPASSPTASNLTKTTILERTTPVSPSGLKTPWTAGAVPYSPYMPNTPLMPITPRLVTKEDRKRQKKEMGRGPVLEIVKSDDELWDSGY